MRRVLSLISSVILTASLLVACQKVEPEVANYREQVKQFEALDLNSLKTKIKGEEHILVYVGRENCPYCVKLVPELLNMKDKLNLEFYYLNVIKTNDEMDKFFDDNKLEYVPSLLYCGKGEVNNIPLDYDYVKKHGSYNTEELTEQLKTITLVEKTSETKTAKPESTKTEATKNKPASSKIAETKQCQQALFVKASAHQYMLISTICLSYYLFCYTVQ